MTFESWVRSINHNVVQLGSAGTKIGSQDAVKKLLQLTEKGKYPNFSGKFLSIFQKSVAHMIHHYNC